MNVKMIESSEKSYGGTSQYYLRPADKGHENLIIMIGVASRRSCLNTIRRNGWTLIETVKYTKEERP